MTSRVAPLLSRHRHDFFAIALAAVVAGSLDLIFAFTFHGVMSHVSPTRVLQSIATGWFGMDALNGGVSTAAIGFFSHYGILLGAALVYYGATQVCPWLDRHAYLCGMVFGIGIYGVMHLVVLPLSNAPAFKGTTVGTIADFSMHVLVIGPAMALTLRRFVQSA